jgi:hypothetical protein
MLEPMAAQRAVETSGAAPAMMSSRGTFPLIFGSSTACTLPQPLPSGSPPLTPVMTVCHNADGFFRHHRSASARYGEVVQFGFRTHVRSVRVSYGRRPAVELANGSGSQWTVRWRIPARGAYYVSIVVRNETPVSWTETTYAILLRVRP